MEIKTCEEYVLAHLENALNELDKKEKRIAELMKERNKALMDLAVLGDKYDAISEALYEVLEVSNDSSFNRISIGGFYTSIYDDNPYYSVIKGVIDDWANRTIEPTENLVEEQ